MNRLAELQQQRRRIDAEIEMESLRLVNEAGARMEALFRASPAGQMTKAQLNYCYFMGIDPNDPDGPPLG